MMTCCQAHVTGGVMPDTGISFEDFVKIRENETYDLDTRYRKALDAVDKVRPGLLRDL